MTHSKWRIGLLAAVLSFGFSLASAQAQATRTWVSGVGDDVNPCSRTAPCKTFAGAISKTAAGGEMSVLDPGAYGTVTITKAMSIVNYNSGEAGMLASGTTGILVNAGPNDVVMLRGLVINGGTSALPGLNGIRFIAGAALHVHNSIIMNFTGASPNGAGILFAPTGTSELYVDDSVILNNGAAGAGGGIFIQPTGSGIARASIDNVRVENNTHGVRADSTTTTGSITVNMYRTTAAGNTGSGVLAQSAAVGGTPVNFMMSNSGLLVNNNGLNAIGSGTVVRIGSSTITGSLNLGVNVTSSAQVLSYKNNQIDGNVSNGTPLTGIGAASPAVGLN